jgi:hypothetical protein
LLVFVGARQICWRAVEAKISLKSAWMYGRIYLECMVSYNI